MLCPTFGLWRAGSAEARSRDQAESPRGTKAGLSSCAAEPSGAESASAGAVGSAEVGLEGLFATLPRNVRISAFRKAHREHRGPHTAEEIKRTWVAFAAWRANRDVAESIEEEGEGSR